jgi:hypothetical protein
VDGAGTDGTLIYIKPAFYGCEPTDVLNYARTTKAFPHESTGDQFFSESQFESYRALGSYVIDRIFKAPPPSPVVSGEVAEGSLDWFVGHAREYVEASAAPAAESARTVSARTAPAWRPVSRASQFPRDSRRLCDGPTSAGPRSAGSRGTGTDRPALAMLATASLWMQHHLGFELKKLGILALVGVIWGAMGKLADWFGVKSTLGGFVDSYIRAPLRGLLHRGVRSGTPASSGRPRRTHGDSLLGDGAERGAGRPWRRVDRAGRRRREGPVDSLRPGRPVRFLPVITSPFGREFRVDADGYLPASVTVYPLISRRVLLGRDLAAAPSVLFRPFEEGAVALLGRGVFRVTRVRGIATEVVASDSGHAASFMLGRSRAVTDAMMGLWGLELDAIPVSGKPKAQLLMLWRRPRQLATPIKLAPNDRLVAEVLVRGKVRARAEVTLSGSPLMDVLMQDVVSDTGKVPP